MMRMYSDQALCFDDILMVPSHSRIESRHSVDISTTIGSGHTTISLRVPIIAAPMDTICGDRMASTLRELGCLGIIHRYMSFSDQIRAVRNVARDGHFVGAAIGSKPDDISHATMLFNSGATLILVDTANGHSQYAIDAVASLKKNFGDSVHIMAGNIATYDGFMRLAEVGVDSVRVGIGGGGLCTTRIVSGHGIPTLASIMDIRSRLPKGEGPSIVADGGIKNPGDAVKAFAAGADAVMVGSALAGTEETPGEIHEAGNGLVFKKLRGMASEEAQREGRGSVSVIEGVSTTVPFAGSVKHVIEKWAGGIGSGLSYSGVDNLYDLHNESEYVIVSYNSLAESKPHAER